VDEHANAVYATYGTSQSLFMPAEVFFTSTLNIAIQPSNPSGLTVRAPTAQSFDCFPAYCGQDPMLLKIKLSVVFIGRQIQLESFR
jgi:hypothetical protein